MTPEREKQPPPADHGMPDAVIVPTLADLVAKVRGDAHEPCPGNVGWNDAQRAVMQATWTAACENFEAFLVVMISLRQKDDGSVTYTPAMVSNGSTFAILAELARFVVANRLASEFREQLLAVLAEAQAKEDATGPRSRS